MDRPLFTIPIPHYDSQLVEDILDVEKLKLRPLVGTTQPAIFFEIKFVFHMMESLGSARIEGNRTTIDDLVESAVLGERDSTEQLREIANIEDAMTWIEEVFERDPDQTIDERFLKELHRLTVKNLRCPTDGGEGDEKPGKFRAGDVRITGTSFIPPRGVQLPALIDELITFVNAPRNSRFDLLRIAMAHHRFVHIHPFRNGNGRVVRLLTYAMLVRAGYRVDDGRIINPTAVFCHDRAAYMNALSAADAMTDDATLAWCSFVLSGLRRELAKIDNLLNAEVLFPQILVPTLIEARDRGIISKIEYDVLTDIVQHQIADSSVFRHHYPNKSPSMVSQIIAGYKQRGLIAPYPSSNSRRYIVKFSGPMLLRSLITTLDRAGYLPL
jgi:Fic family protein